MTDPIAAAREEAFELAADKGTHCPVCTQFVKIYKRNISSTVARQLIRAWRFVNAEGDWDAWFHLGQAVGYAGGDIAKLRYWGLLEEWTEARREDGGRAGYWRFTELGALWVQGRESVHKHAYVFDGNRHGLDGPPWTIQDALGKGFDLRELLQPSGPPPEPLTP